MTRTHECCPQHSRMKENQQKMNGSNEEKISKEGAKEMFRSPNKLRNTLPIPTPRNCELTT